MPDQPPPNLRIREVAWGDFQGLVDTYWLLYEERETNPEIGITLFGSRPSHADEAQWFARTFERVLSGASVMRVAEVDRHVVGNCLVNRVGATADSEEAHVGDLGILVHRDFRGRGIGSALMRATLAACRGRFDVVRLSVFSANAGARRLYERLGFVPYGHLPGAVRRGGRYLDVDLMRLDLRPPHANG